MQHCTKTCRRPASFRPLVSLRKLLLQLRCEGRVCEFHRITRSQRKSCKQPQRLFSQQSQQLVSLFILNCKDIVTFRRKRRQTNEVGIFTQSVASHLVISMSTLTTVFTIALCKTCKCSVLTLNRKEQICMFNLRALNKKGQNPMPYVDSSRSKRLMSFVFFSLFFYCLNNDEFFKAFRILLLLSQKYNLNSNLHI